MVLLVTLVSISVLLPSVQAACAADNCLRALRSASYVATDFCRTYTSATPPPTPSPTITSTFTAPCGNSPQRASSACSCAVPKQTGCVPTIRQDNHLLQNSDFNLNNAEGAQIASQATYWDLSISKAADQAVGPDAHYDRRPYINQLEWHFNVTYLPSSVKPDLSFATLKQTFNTLCSGTYSLTYAANFLSDDPNGNCSVTTSIEGYAASVKTTFVPSYTPNNEGLTSYWGYTFTLDGVAAAGTTAVLDLVVRCTGGAARTAGKIDDVQLTYAPPR